MIVADAFLAYAKDAFNAATISSLFFRLADRFWIDAWLNAEPTEEEILGLGNVGDLLGEGTDSFEFSTGWGVIKLVCRHGFGSANHLGFLVTEELGKSFTGRGLCR